MCCRILILITPTKIAFLLTTFSIIIGIFMYSTRASVFCARAVIISFSSGIIVVLCYCSISSNFETKRISKITEAAIVSTLMITLTIRKIKYRINQEIIIKIFINSIIISLMIIFIFIAIKAVNINILNPTKSIILTY